MEHVPIKIAFLRMKGLETCVAVPIRAGNTATLELPSNCQGADDVGIQQRPIHVLQKLPWCEDVNRPWFTMPFENRSH